MATIAVFNQQAGVGKTTTALHLLAGIAQRGQRPLGIDLDPQARLSQAFGVQPWLADDSVYGFLMQRRPLGDVAVITRSGIVLCPSHPELAQLDSRLGKGLNVITRLRAALRGTEKPEGSVVIDCGALFNVLSLNAVFACDLLLVPVSSDFLALTGAQAVDKALDALEPVLRRRLPRRYVLTGFRAGQGLSGEIAQRMVTLFRPEEICATRIRESVALARRSSLPLDGFLHPPGGDLARDYDALVEELASAGFVR